MSKMILNIQPLECPSCSKEIKRTLASEKAIRKVDIIAHLGKIRLEYDAFRINPAAIKQLLNETGYAVLSEGGNKR